MWQLLKGFAQAGYQITFATAAVKEKHSASLEPLGITSHPIKLNHASFDRWLKTSRFEVVLFDRFLTEEQFSWRVREQLPQSVLLLDTEDLHSLRHSRESAVKENRYWEPSDWLKSPVLYRELASILRCDLSLIISRAELDLLHARLPFLEGRLMYLPFQFSPDEVSAGPGFSQRSGFVFVGNGKHRPNLDAIFRLKSRIWPVLRERVPNSCLKIFGAYLPTSIQNLNAPEEGFEVQGWAPELQPIFESARLQLAPLHFGAGVKGKILSALRFGLPTLSTAIGWEGIYEGTASVDFLAKDPGDFVKKAALLYASEGAWGRSLRLQLKASAHHFEPSLGPLLDAMENPAKRRESLPEASKVLQEMLRHQAFDRVRYLSRWIEAKQDRSN
jgi:hypothetical protein